MIDPTPLFAAAMAISFGFILQVDISSSFSPATSFSFDPKTSLSQHHTSRQHRRIILPASMSNGDDSSSLNMDDLRKRMQRQENQYAALLMEQVNYAIEDEDDEKRRMVPESVHIILFHPDTPQQHVHTIEFPKSSGNNIILAFESGADCVKFARMLQDLEFADPSVSAFVKNHCISDWVVSLVILCICRTKSICFISSLFLI